MLDLPTVVAGLWRTCPMTVALGRLFVQSLARQAVTVNGYASIGQQQPYWRRQRWRPTTGPLLFRVRYIVVAAVAVAAIAHKAAYNIFCLGSLSLRSYLDLSSGQGSDPQPKGHICFFASILLLLLELLPSCGNDLPVHTSAYFCGFSPKLAKVNRGRFQLPC